MDVDQQEASLNAAVKLLELMPWVQRLVREAEGKSGLTSSRAGLLFALTRERLRGSDIADRWGISRASVTEAAQSLGRLGLLRREKDPSDGRASFFVITPKGQRALERFGMVTTAALAEHVGRMEPELQTALERSTTALASLLAQPAAKSGDRS